MKTKRFIIFTVVATLLLGTVVFAADLETIQASLTNIKLFLNGNKVDKKIIVVDGSSYLPVRAISEALGLDGNWNGDTKLFH